jgi:hypothetical protein
MRKAIHKLNDTVPSSDERYSSAADEKPRKERTTIIRSFDTATSPLAFLLHAPVFCNTLESENTRLAHLCDNTSGSTIRP